MLTKILFCAPLLFLACGNQVDSVDETRFVGTWAVENGLDHLYSGSLYDLMPDGALVHRRDVAADGSSKQVGGVDFYEIDDSCLNTGMGCPLIASCSFGDSWAAVNHTQIEIQLSCSDEKSRTALLNFPSDKSQNSVGTSVELGGVDGMLDGWELSAREFRRCPSDTDCLRSFP